MMQTTLVWRVVLVCVLVTLTKGSNLSQKPYGVFKVSSRRNGSSYFGYSISCKNEAQQTLFLIGAPRASLNGKGGIASGTVSRCVLDGACAQISLPFTRNAAGSWTGAQTLIHGNDVFVGSPRWTVQRNISSIPGAVHKITSKDGTTFTYQKSYISNTLSSSENFAGQQAGMSFSQDGSTLFLGAMNVDANKGSVFSLDMDTLLPFETDPAGSQFYDQSQYFGYSIASMKGAKGSILAVGTPRALMQTGAVHLVNLPQYQGDSMRHWGHIGGSQIGEYFGCVVEAYDLDGDGDSELLVSSPFRSRDGLANVGAVAVIWPWQSSKSFVLKGDSLSHSFFGLAVAPPIDLDLDGSIDVIIGAPHEHRGEGSIYVFSGPLSSDSLWSQKVKASQLGSSSTPKGFGMAFSQPFTTRHDLFPGTAIGAPMSDEVFLLVSRPIVDIMTTTEGISAIPVPSSSLSYMVCSTVTPRKQQPNLHTIDVWMELQVKHSSEGRRAVVFQQNAMDTVFSKLTLQMSQQKCFPVNISIDMRAVNPYENIRVTVQYELQEPFNTKYHLSGSKKDSTIASTHEIPFAVKCKEELCAPKFLIQQSVHKVEEDYVVSLLVQNEGSTAFQSTVQLEFVEPQIASSLLAFSCGPHHDSRTHECHLPSPFFSGDQMEINVTIGGRAFNVQNTRLLMKATATSSAFAQTKSQTHKPQVIAFNFTANSSILLDSWSNTEVLKVHPKDSKTNFLRADHHYSIKNRGPSGAESILLSICVFIDQNENIIEDIIDNINSNVNYSCSDMEGPYIGELFGNLSSISKAFNKRIECRVGPFVAPSDYAQLALSIYVSSKRLGIHPRDEIVVTSQLVASYPRLHQDTFEGQRMAYQQQHTVIHKTSEVASKQMWTSVPVGVHAASVVAGCIIQALLTVALKKWGFFRRNTRLRMLREKSELEEAQHLSTEEENYYVTVLS